MKYFFRHLSLFLLPSLSLALACTVPPGDPADGSGGSGVVGSGGLPPIGGVETGGTTGTATGGTTAGTGGAGPTWQLVWSDEFDGSGALDDTKWNYETKPAGWVNNELQRYAGARSENVRKENGSLIIEARRDYFEGTEYSSARIHSTGKGDFLYGRFEIRAKLPTAKGSWPALWMMPSEIFKYATKCSAASGWVEGCDAWPNSGEIDIMEHVGHEVGVVHATIHCQKYNWQQAQQATSQVDVADVAGTFHVYSMEWSPTKIEAFVDDVKYFSYENPNQGWQAWPFDQPFHFIFNIAVGGSWGGAQGVDPAAFPARLEVDYARAYELAGG